MAGFLGVAAPIIGAGASYLQGRGQAKASKEMLRRQAQGADLMNQQYRAAMPQYQSSLQALARQAGLDPSYSDQRRATDPSRAWGTPEDQTRFQMAEDQISQLARNRANQLGHAMHQRGIATGSQASALAANERDALNQLAGFRRQLAVNAPHEQQQRIAALLGALNPALSMGGQAANIYGQQGLYQGQQAAQSFGGIGQLAQGYLQNQALQHYLGQQGGGGGGATVNPDGTIGFGTQMAYASPEQQQYGLRVNPDGTVTPGDDGTPWWARG